MNESTREPAGLAVVTGASAGIGRAFAERLAARGHDLLLVARRAGLLEELAGRLAAAHGVRCEALPLDLADRAAVEELAGRVESAPDLTLLVNDAGLTSYGRFVDLDPARELEQIAVMSSALVRLTRAALPPMVARGRGAVIQVSSRAGFQPIPMLATYASVKAQVTGFTVALAAELRGTGVRVQALCPRNTRTELFERAGIPPEERAAILDGALEPLAVVDASLAALERGEVVCVPDERALVRLARRVLPRGPLLRLTGVLRRVAGC